MNYQLIITAVVILAVTGGAVEHTVAVSDRAGHGITHFFRTEPVGTERSHSHARHLVSRIQRDLRN